MNVPEPADDLASTSKSTTSKVKERAVQAAVSLLIGGGMLWFAFRDLPANEAAMADGVVTFSERLSSLWEMIAVIPWQQHLLYLSLVIIQFILRSLRWRIQAEGVSGSSIPVRQALAINSVAFAAVFLLPFRLGEFVRPVLSQRHGFMSASAGLANSAVERILDGLVTSVFFAGVLIFLGDRSLPSYVQNAGVLAFVVFGAIALSLVLAVVWREASIKFWQALLEKIHPILAEKLVGLLVSFLDGLRCFRTFAAFAGYFFITAIYWLLNGAAVWLLLRGMGIEVDLVVGYFCLSFLILAVMLPAPPGNLGNFHAFCKESLMLLGVGAGPALAFAIVLHAWQVLSLLLWSGFWLLTGEVSLGEVAEAASGDEPVDSLRAQAK
ncbi:MAG: flippase-like domain-containing protein [Deltaproteobacteria bacterium]|nr:flippase-like domain-containing protein [Deltaproteobacteria bacterium]